MHPQGLLHLVKQHRQREEEKKISLDLPPPLIRQTAKNKLITPRTDPLVQRKSQLYPAAKALFSQRRRPSIDAQPDLSTISQQEEESDT